MASRRSDRAYDARSILRVRLADPEEAAAYRQTIEVIKPPDDINIVYPVEVDDDLF